MRKRTFALYAVAFVLQLTLGCDAHANLLSNGDFEAGNTGWSSSYQYVADHNALPQGAYGIVTNAHDLHWDAVSFGDHSTSTGRMMMVNGKTTANSLVWSQTVSVQASRAYDFSMWVSTWEGTGFPPPTFAVFVGGNQLGSSFTPTDAPGTWDDFAARWTSGSSTSAVVEVRLASAFSAGNEFCLDDLVFSPVMAQPDPSHPISPTGVVTGTSSPTFTWAEVPTADWYHLWVVKDGRKFASAWTKTPLWIPHDPLEPGRYSWWVRTWNTLGYGPWSPRADFEIPFRVPVAPVLLGPMLTVETNRPTFAWEPVEFGEWYHLLVTRNQRIFVKQWLRAQVSHVPEEDEALPFGDYAFWVRAWGQDGMGEWSSPMSFFFGRTHPLEPSGSVSGSGLEFHWIPVEGAAWYQVWIVMPDKTSLTSWVQGATRWTPDVASFDPGSYTWYVRAWKPDGSGPWSEGAWFSVPSPSSYSWSGSSSVVYYGTRGTS